MTIICPFCEKSDGIDQEKVADRLFALPKNIEMIEVRCSPCDKVFCHREFFDPDSARPMKEMKPDKVLPEVFWRKPNAPLQHPEHIEGLLPEKPLDVQVGGSHYKDMKIQPVEFCQKNQLPACESAIIKYVCRHKNKNGLEDLKKAKHYIDLLIELEYS